MLGLSREQAQNMRHFICCLTRKGRKEKGQQWLTHGTDNPQQKKCSLGSYRPRAVKACCSRSAARSESLLSRAARANRVSSVASANAAFDTLPTLLDDFFPIPNKVDSEADVGFGFGAGGCGLYVGAGIGGGGISSSGVTDVGGGL
mmetsp:Transcript_24524/g.45366  ORF Transcript_24524/g.45366 Transcript_24524/m.45366 type:complete len:146 (+) Transcript_24524:82-519(+)